MEPRLKLSFMSKVAIRALSHPAKRRLSSSTICHSMMAEMHSTEATMCPNLLKPRHLPKIHSTGGTLRQHSVFINDSYLFNRYDFSLL